MNISIILLTLNAEKEIDGLLYSITQCPLEKEIIVIDSSSKDNTVSIAQKFPVNLKVIPQNEFDHGGTRQMAAEMAQGNILIYITQDIVLKEDSIEQIVEVFNDDKVAVAYGRQLPHKNATPFAAHLRAFNYPKTPNKRQLSDKSKYGIKTVLSSDSFSAYRKSVLMEVGGFPKTAIVSEDAYVAAKMLLAGYCIAYAAESEVVHSHNHNFIQEFRKYFDVGVFYHREKWIKEGFGGAESSGSKFIQSEIRYLLKLGYWYLIPASLIRNVFKFLGYQFGKFEKFFPRSIKKKLSAQSYYWNKH